MDESGSFTFSAREGKPWSVIGALSLDEKKLKYVELALQCLKSDYGFPASEEFKSSHLDIEEPLPLIRLIGELGAIGGVFTASIIFTPQDKYDDYLKFAISDNTTLNRSNPFKLPKQLQIYLQANLMLDAMNAAAWGANGYFSLKAPTTLKSIKWIIDEKSLVDEFTREYIQNWASGEGHRHQYEIRKIQGIVPNKIQKYHPSGYTSGFSAGKVFQDVNYSKSEDHIGLQVADLLAGSLRRCLKEAWEKNTSAVAGALSKLMIRQTPWLTITESKPESGKANKSILPISNRFKELVLEEPSALAILSEGAPLPKRP